MTRPLRTLLLIADVLTALHLLAGGASGQVSTVRIQQCTGVGCRTYFGSAVNIGKTESGHSIYLTAGHNLEPLRQGSRGVISVSQGDRGDYSRASIVGQAYRPAEGLDLGLIVASTPSPRHMPFALARKTPPDGAQVKMCGIVAGRTYQEIVSEVVRENGIAKLTRRPKDGMSGGPVLYQGRVVGVVVGREETHGRYGRFVPVEEVRAFARQELGALRYIRSEPPERQVRTIPKEPIEDGGDGETGRQDGATADEPAQRTADADSAGDHRGTDTPERRPATDSGRNNAEAGPVSVADGEPDSGGRSLFGRLLGAAKVAGPVLSALAGLGLAGTTGGAGYGLYRLAIGLAGRVIRKRLNDDEPETGGGVEVPPQPFPAGAPSTTARAANVGQLGTAAA